MFLPGQVEHWNIIYDLDGMGLTDVPIGSLKSAVQQIGQNYGGRLYKMWLLNCPGNIYFSWKIVKNFLSQVTVDKISMERKSTDESLWKYYDKSQIEKKYGGTQPDKTSFYPMMIPKAVVEEERLVSDAQYEEYLKSGFLKRNVIDPKYTQKKEQQKKQAEIKAE